MHRAPAGQTLLRRFCFVVLLLILAIPTAFAHKASDAYLQVRHDPTGVTVRVDVALRDLDRELVLDQDGNGELTWGEVRRRHAEIQSLIDQNMVWRIQDATRQPCKPGDAEALQLERHSDGRYAVLQRRWTCSAAPAEATLTYRLFAVSDPTHRGVLSWQQAGAQRITVVAPGDAALSLSWHGPAGATSEQGTSDHGWMRIFQDGVHHIWIGVDHVLFLVVLLLPSVLRREAGAWVPAEHWRSALGRVLAVVTAFTVAHSITLGLAVLDEVQPSSRWVESLIALSVLLAALNNLRPLIVASRWRFTFLFGLVHGFGFANALRDIGLAKSELVGPLLLFNLGVEVGQLAIVGALVPLLWWWRRWRGYPSWLLMGGSAVVAAIAAVWLVERVFDLQLLGLGG